MAPGRKVSDIEDLASHDGPESCGYIRKAAPAAVIGVPTNIHALQSFRTQVQRHWLCSRRCGLVSVGACKWGAALLDFLSPTVEAQWLGYNPLGWKIPASACPARLGVLPRQLLGRRSGWLCVHAARKSQQSCVRALLNRQETSGRGGLRCDFTSHH